MKLLAAIASAPTPPQKSQLDAFAEGDCVGQLESLVFHSLAEEIDGCWRVTKRGQAVLDARARDFGGRS